MGPSLSSQCGCLHGLFGAAAPGAGASSAQKRRSGTAGTLPPDIVVTGDTGGGVRRFAAAENLTVEEVFKLVRPRAVSVEYGRPDGKQSWATPLPRPGASAGQDVKRQISGEAADPAAASMRTVRATAPVDRKFQVEQLISSPGVLPAPLTAHEREQVIRKLLPTATYEMLSRLPKHLVEAEGLEGQTLRRRLLNGATVVFFTAGYAGKRFVFERAKQLGIRTVVIEHPDSWVQDLVKEGVIAKFIPIDMGQSSDAIIQQSVQAIKSLGNDGVTGEADAVLTLVELSVPLVARLCERLGLPGPTPQSVDAARDKHATRAALKAAGLPTPRNTLIRSAEEVAAAAEYVGYPAVLKPVSGAASLGVKKVTCETELMDCYNEVVNELRGLIVVSGALQQNDGSGKGVKADQVVCMAVLLEQYLDGCEVDLDIVMSEGEWRYCGITDNGPTIEPYFNETWGVCPSMLPLEQQRELKDLGVACVKALGFASGVFHVEAKYTSTGPQLIEVNARMGGGPVHEHNLRTWGVDLVEESIFVALGIPARPCAAKAPLEASAYYVVPSQTSGIVEEMPDLVALSRRKEVVWAKPYVRVGDRVTGPADGMPTWLVEIMVAAPTAKEALDLVWRLEVENRVKVAPPPKKT